MTKFLKSFLEWTFVLVLVVVIWVALDDQGLLPGSDNAKKRTEQASVVDYSRSPSFGDRVVTVYFPGEVGSARFNCTKKNIQIGSANNFRISAGWYSYRNLSRHLSRQIGDWGSDILVSKLQSLSDDACSS